MLYQDRKLGQPSIWRALTAHTARWNWRRQRIADLDLLAFSDHMRRDVGIGSVPEPVRFDEILWRK